MKVGTHLQYLGAVKRNIGREGSQLSALSLVSPTSLGERRPDDEGRQGDQAAWAMANQRRSWSGRRSHLLRGRRLPPARVSAVARSPPAPALGVPSSGLRRSSPLLPALVFGAEIRNSFRGFYDLHAIRPSSRSLLSPIRHCRSRPRLASVGVV